MRVLSFFALCFAFIVVVQSRHFNSNHHHADGPIYDGLNFVLNEAFEHNRIIANDFSQRMNHTLNSIKSKIDDLKNNNTFIQKLQSFKAEANICLKENEQIVAVFMKDLMNTFESCTEEIGEVVSNKLDKLKESITVIKTSPNKIEEIEKECIGTQEKYLAGSSICVVTRVAEVQQELSVANLSVKKFFEYGIEELESYFTEKCKGIKELQEQFDSVFTKVESCIEKKLEQHQNQLIS